MSAPTQLTVPGGLSRSTRLTPVASGVVAKGGELVTLVLLATVVPRVLGPAAYGEFTVALTVVMIGTAALALGGTPLMSRFVPAAPPADRVALARTLGVRLAVGRSGQLAALILVAAALALARPDAFPPGLVALTTVALAANVVATLALQIGLGLGRTGPWNLRYPLQNAVLVGAVLLLYPVAGTTGAVIAIVAASACALAVGAVAVRGVVTRRGTPSARLPDGALRFGRRQGLGWALLQFTQRGGVLAVALLAGTATQAGFAALAIGVAVAAVYAVLRLFVVSLPKLAEGADAPDDGGGPGAVPPAVTRGEAQLRGLAGRLLAVLLPTALVGVAVLHDAVPLVFGPAYTASASAFVPMLAMVVLAPLSALVLQSATLRVRAEATLASALVGAVAFVATSLLAVPAWGAVGGTTATLTGAATTTAVAGRMLPGAVGWRLGGASAVGAAAVLVVGALA